MKKFAVWLFALLAFFILLLYILLIVLDLETSDIIYTLAATIGFYCIVSVIFFAYNLKKDKKIEWLSNRLEQWSNLSIHVQNAGNEAFTKLPIGIMVFDETKSVKWVNAFSNEIFETELLEKTLNEVNQDLNECVSLKKEQFTLFINHKYYDVMHKVDSKVLYFFEVTEKIRIKTLHQSKQVAMGIINLDNLDSETKNFDIHEKVNLRGQYLGEIADWVNRYSGYLKNFDDDSLLLVTDNAALSKMIEDKFDILDKIRQISKENGVRVTLSIGIASFDVNFEELGNLAQTAFDLAEKRGGDQAVINVQNNKVQFFGASSNAIEKNTLLAARNKTNEFRELVEASRNVYITAHINADADAFGAMIGVLKLCQLSTPKSKIVLDVNRLDPTTSKLYESLLNPYFQERIVDFSETDIDEDSLLVIVDTQSPNILMDKPFYEKFTKVALIDHHRAGEVGFENIVYSYVEPYASSTVELVSEMMMFYNPKQKLELSTLEATIMLTGIVVDTFNFTFRCGTRAFDAVSRLKESGADMILVRKILRNDYNVAIKLNKYVSSAELFLDQFAIVEIKEDISDQTILAQVSDSLLNIGGVDAAFTIASSSKNGGLTTSISARSYDRVNVQVIMEELGGGGHLNSAATQVSNESVREVKNRLEFILKRDFEIGDEQMKVILLEDVKGRGQKDQIIDVATGFGNYLITNKKGVIASPEEIKKLNEALDAEKQRVDDEKKMIERIKSEIEGKVVNVYIKTGSDGKVFGSVTTKQIADELAAQHGIEVDKRKINLPVEISSLGIYSVSIQLHKDVTANLDVNVLEK